MPPGFAHGFLVVSETEDFQYKRTVFYEKKYERAVHWTDQELEISWPLKSGEKPLTSHKDKYGKPFSSAAYYA
ncbi:dTDP-4-dehydrorhamnose 3,5-epimerase [Idiomarina fontislapidosi]|nr:dTDP-4-dehydrorhamnose 3,5-epimerase [Idiomarina fontislapidosi]